MKSFLSKCKDKKIYLYGAGDYGKIVYFFLLDNGIEIEGFVVSKRQPLLTHVVRRPVFELNELDESAKDAFIIITTSPIYQEEIRNELMRKSFINFISVSDEDVHRMDKLTVFNIDTKTDKYVNILLYHRVCNLENDPWGLAVSQEDFEAHIKYMKENYRILRFDEAWDTVDKKAIVITFDDGYIDNYKYALPILEKYEVPATIFVSTGNIDSNKEFWWDELFSIVRDESKCKQIRKQILAMLPEERERYFEALKKEYNYVNVDSNEARTMNSHELMEISKSPYITIGAHTISHSVLSNEPAMIQKKEIVESRKVIEEIIQKPVTCFSYPFGSVMDYNEDTISIVKEEGFDKVAAVGGGLVGDDTNRYTIPRNNIAGGTDVHRLKRELNKIWYEYS